MKRFNGEEFVSLEEERLYSTGSDELDELLEKAFCEGYEYAQREFGTRSKVLAVVSPGAWHAKEAAKYAEENEDDYRENKKYLLRGNLAPLTTLSVKKKVQEMAANGATKEEIRDYLENKGPKKNLSRLAGTAEALTGSAGGVGHIVGYVKGFQDVADDKRADWVLKDKESYKD